MTDKTPTTHTGVISFINCVRGFGFIWEQETREYIYFWRGALIDCEISDLREGMAVSYMAIPDNLKPDKMRAVNVSIGE